jgi:hypothetical protein
MMHLTFSDKDLLVGDEVADLVVEYTAALVRASSADTVNITAYGADGDKVTAKLLLETGAPLMVETSHTDLPEPDNTEVTEYMRERLARLEDSSPVQPMTNEDATPMVDFENDWNH